MYRDAILSEFSHQAESFNVSRVMSSARTLQGLIDFIPTSTEQEWIDVACGPGLVSRALAPRVGSVVGVDLTAAMVQVAARETAGLPNVRFELGDAARLAYADGTFDGAVTRFSMHHVPVAIRMVEEMARVVKPDGFVVLADHIQADDHDEAMWHEAIERLRDPSHWQCLSHRAILDLGHAAGLRVEREQVVPFDLDFEEWLNRGSGGPEARPLIERLLSMGRSSAFRMVDGVLTLQYSMTLWRR